MKRPADEEADADRVLDGVVTVPAPNTVWKYAGNDLEFKATAKKHLIVIGFGDAGVIAGAAIDLRGYVRQYLALFTDIAARRGLPRAQRRAYVIDRTQVLTNELIERMPAALSDALLGLTLETSTVIGRVQSAVERGTEEPDFSPKIERAKIARISHLAEQLLKRRLNARGRGRESRVDIILIARAMYQHGAEDAQARAVAPALGLTERQLRNLRKSFGFDSWPEFVNYIVNLVERKST